MKMENETTKKRDCVLQLTRTCLNECNEVGNVELDVVEKTSKKYQIEPFH